MQDANCREQSAECAAAGTTARVSGCGSPLVTLRPPPPESGTEVADASRNLPSGPGVSPIPIELERADCPLCGGHRHDTVVVASDSLTGLGGTFCVVRCRDCQLAFTNPRPTPTCISLFYPKNYRPFSGREWAESRPLRRSLEQAVLSRLYGYQPQPADRNTVLLSYLGRMTIRRSRQRLAWIPFRDPGRLLDFGCGAGRFLEKMRAFGWSVEGLDISPRVAGRLQSAGIPVHVGTLPHPDLEPDSYDVITMWNSLEHVHQPRDVVRSAGRLLRRGGLLVIGVPNFASWSFRTFREDWYALELPRHLVHFTPRTILDLVVREGFRVLSLKHVARSGCLRKSARRAVEHGGLPWRWTACRWKLWGLPVAQWTERTQQADFIRLVAEKP